MRRSFGIFLLGIWALTAFGQIAPDLVRGTSADDVIRHYGWPKGKSVAEGREIWLYDRFQVRFEDGKVAGVAYSSPSPGAAKGPMPKLVPPPATAKASPGANETRGVAGQSRPGVSP